MPTFLPIGKVRKSILPLVSLRFTTLNRQIFMGISFLMLFTIQTYGQDESWTLLKEENGVRVFYQIAKCNSSSDVDPLKWANGDPTFDLFQLKIVNNNETAKDISYSHITKTDGSNEKRSVTASPGETLLEGCDKAPHLKLTSAENDNYPVAFTDFLEVFSLSIND